MFFYKPLFWIQNVKKTANRYWIIPLVRSSFPYPHALHYHITYIIWLFQWSVRQFRLLKIVYIAYIQL